MRDIRYNYYRVVTIYYISIKYNNITLMLYIVTKVLQNVIDNVI